MRDPHPTPQMAPALLFQSPRLRGYGCGLVLPLRGGRARAVFQSPRLRGYGCGRANGDAKWRHLLRFNPLVCGDTDAGRTERSLWVHGRICFNPLVCGDTDAGLLLPSMLLSLLLCFNPLVCGDTDAGMARCGRSCVTPTVSIPSSAGIRMRDRSIDSRMRRGLGFQSPRLRGYGCGRRPTLGASHRSGCFNPLVCGDTDAGVAEAAPYAAQGAWFQSPRLRGYGCGYRKDVNENE